MKQKNISILFLIILIIQQTESGKDGLNGGKNPDSQQSNRYYSLAQKNNNLHGNYGYTAHQNKPTQNPKDLQNGYRLNDSGPAPEIQNHTTLYQQISAFKNSGSNTNNRYQLDTNQEVSKIKIDGDERKDELYKKTYTKMNLPMLTHNIRTFLSDRSIQDKYRESVNYQSFILSMGLLADLLEYKDNEESLVDDSIMLFNSFKNYILRMDVIEIMHDNNTTRYLHVDRDTHITLVNVINRFVNTVSDLKLASGKTNRSKFVNIIINNLNVINRMLSHNDANTNNMSIVEEKIVQKPDLNKFLIDDIKLNIERVEKLTDHIKHSVLEFPIQKVIYLIKKMMVKNDIDYAALGLLNGLVKSVINMFVHAKVIEDESNDDVYVKKITYLLKDFEKLKSKIQICENRFKIHPARILINKIINRLKEGSVLIQVIEDHAEEETRKERSYLDDDETTSLNKKYNYTVYKLGKIVNHSDLLYISSSIIKYLEDKTEYPSGKVDNLPDIRELKDLILTLYDNTNYDLTDTIGQFYLYKKSDVLKIKNFGEKLKKALNKYKNSDNFKIISEKTGILLQHIDTLKKKSSDNLAEYKNNVVDTKNVQIITDYDRNADRFSKLDYLRIIKFYENLNDDDKFEDEIEINEDLLNITIQPNMRTIKRLFIDLEHREPIRSQDYKYYSPLYKMLINLILNVNYLQGDLHYQDHIYNLQRIIDFLFYDRYISVFETEDLLKFIYKLSSRKIQILRHTCHSIYDLILEQDKYEEDLQLNSIKLLLVQIIIYLAGLDNEKSSTFELIEIPFNFEGLIGLDVSPAEKCVENNMLGIYVNENTKARQNVVDLLTKIDNNELKIKNSKLQANMSLWLIYLYEYLSYNVCDIELSKNSEEAILIANILLTNATHEEITDHSGYNYFNMKTTEDLNRYIQQLVNLINQFNGEKRLNNATIEIMTDYLAYLFNLHNNKTFYIENYPALGDILRFDELSVFFRDMLSNSIKRITKKDRGLLTELRRGSSLDFNLNNSVKSNFDEDANSLVLDKNGSNIGHQMHDDEEFGEFIEAPVNPILHESINDVEFEDEKNQSIHKDLEDDIRLNPDEQILHDLEETRNHSLIKRNEDEFVNQDYTEIEDHGIEVNVPEFEDQNNLRLTKNKIIADFNSLYEKLIERDLMKEDLYKKIVNIIEETIQILELIDDDQITQNLLDKSTKVYDVVDNLNELLNNQYNILKNSNENILLLDDSMNDFLSEIHKLGDSHNSEKLSEPSQNIIDVLNDIKNTYNPQPIEEEEDYSSSQIQLSNDSIVEFEPEMKQIQKKKIKILVLIEVLRCGECLKPNSHMILEDLLRQ